MKEKNKLIIAIVAVILIIVVVFGATYAYWQWKNADTDNTNVAFIIPNNDSQLSANLNGGAGIDISNLAPCACTNSTYAMMRPMALTYSNNTTQPAQVKATLKITSWTAPLAFQSGDLGHLNYAVTTSPTNCTTDLVSSMYGTFPNGTTTNTILINDVVLKNVPVGGKGTNEPYYLWVWLDIGYDGENVGNNILDPMQKLSFQLEWSGTIENIVS